MNNSDYEENFKNESEYENDKKLSKPELIDNFLFFESYNMIILLENIKNHFSNTSPFFLDYIKIYNLSDFIINLLFLNKSYTQFKNFNLNFIELFRSTYYNELNISYNIIYNFLKKFNYNIDFKIWILFCITYSNLYELQL